MNIRWMTLPATMLLFLAAPFAAQRANADAGAPNESDAQALDGGADADAGPALPAFDEEPFSDERTPSPKPKEWESARRVVFDAQKPELPSGCEAYRLREWIRVRCTGNSMGAISLLGGHSEGLSMKLDLIKDEFLTFPEGGEVVFPVRRGDKRVIEWLSISWGYRGANSVEPWFVLSEHWLPEDARPTIALGQ